jgi:CRP-like cAMP-binding protein
MHLTPNNRSSRAKLALLRKIPAFAGCSERELAETARHVDEWSVGVGATLTKEGAIGHEAFIIVEGRADVVIHGETVAELGPGDFVGEMAMLDHRPRSATVVAKTPMALLLIGPEAFDDFTSQRVVARLLNRALSDRLRQADAKVGLKDAVTST